MIYFPMQEQEEQGLNDEDIQVLIKVTLLTQVSDRKAVTIFIPYLKKFCPKVRLAENMATFVPLFHTLHFQVSGQGVNQSANVDLTPLLNNPTHVHYLTIQTYDKEKAGSVYSLHVEFAQTIVRAKGANHLTFNLRKIHLKAKQIKESKPSLLTLQLRVSHGATWRSKPLPSNQLLQFNENPTTVYHSLLDTVFILLYRQKQKLCEAKRFIFELLGDQGRTIDLLSQSSKKASLKLTIKPQFDILFLDNP